MTVDGEFALSSRKFSEKNLLTSKGKGHINGLFPVGPLAQFGRAADF